MAKFILKTKNNLYYQKSEAARIENQLTKDKNKATQFDDGTTAMDERNFLNAILIGMEFDLDIF